MMGGAEGQSPFGGDLGRGFLALSARMLRAAAGARLWDGLTTRPKESYIVGPKDNEG